MRQLQSESAGEVDTSAMASAVLKSGTQLSFRFSSVLDPSHFPSFPSSFSRVLYLPSRVQTQIWEESVCAEGGLYTPWEWAFKKITTTRPTLGAERRLGHQRTDIPMLRRTQDEYIIHLLSVQLSHGHFAYRWIDDGTLAGEAATDEGRNPLDDIVMPGKVRGLFSFFTRIYSKRLKKTLCDTSFIFPWLYPLFVGFDDRLYDSDTGRATTTANSSLRTRSSLLLAGARSHFTINLTS